jgi:hypothetical protein
VKAVHRLKKNADARRNTDNGVETKVENQLLFAASSLRRAIEEIDAAKLACKKHRKQSLIIAVCSLESVIDHIEKIEEDSKGMNNRECDSFYSLSWCDSLSTAVPCFVFDSNDSDPADDCSSCEDDSTILSEKSSVPSERDTHQILVELREGETALRRTHKLYNCMRPENITHRNSKRRSNYACDE